MTIERMDIEEAGPDPARQAQVLLGQLGLSRGPVPVFDIANELDIVEIRIAHLKGIEAALVTTPERDVGAVAISNESSLRRQNFSLAHELGHFLNPWHKPASATGFECGRRDMEASRTRGARSRHARQEAEANRFAIELLAPRQFMAPLVDGPPDMSRILDAAETFQISKTAAARRYVELHRSPLAIVSSKNGRMSQYARSRNFPLLAPRVKEPVPNIQIPQSGQTTAWEWHDPKDWLARCGDATLRGQTLGQVDGHAMTLLYLQDRDRGQCTC